MTTLRIRQPDDFHVHLRQGEMLEHVLAPTALIYGRALVMPNLTPPILTGKDAMEYRQRIKRLALALGAPTFEPLMTIKLVSSTTPATITEAKKAGVIAGKLYPEGVTTNSEDGVKNMTSMWPAFAQMEMEDMVLCLHGETPGVFCMDREAHFLRTLEELVKVFPKLRIVLEHVTTAQAVDLIDSFPSNVAATITVHHLLLTLDDVVGGMLKPHHFCKPIAKRVKDREALVQAATGGSPRFFLGTDSAPHARGTKECASGCAGVYTSPVAMEVLAELFEREASLEHLEKFTSAYGALFYGLPLNERYVDLEKVEPYTVPEHLPGDIVPFKAGEKLHWLCKTVSQGADPDATVQP